MEHAFRNDSLPETNIRLCDAEMLSYLGGDVTVRSEGSSCFILLLVGSNPVRWCGSNRAAKSICMLPIHSGLPDSIYDHEMLGTISEVKRELRDNLLKHDASSSSHSDELLSCLSQLQRSILSSLQEFRDHSDGAHVQERASSEREKHISPRQAGPH